MKMKWAPYTNETGVNALKDLDECFERLRSSGRGCGKTLTSWEVHKKKMEDAGILVTIEDAESLLEVDP
jgi:hypothetical protein